MSLNLKLKCADCKTNLKINYRIKNKKLVVYVNECETCGHINKKLIQSLENRIEILEDEDDCK